MFYSKDWSVNLQPPDSLQKEWIAGANGETRVRIFLARKQSGEKKEVISIKAGLRTKKIEQKNSVNIDIICDF